MELLGIISVDFDITDQLLIILNSSNTLTQGCNGTIDQLFTDFKKAYKLLAGRFCTLFSVTLIHPRKQLG
jgi:hypothetical protein